MSKRLQVLVSEEEYQSYRSLAIRDNTTVGEWVRGALRNVVRESNVRPAHEKIKAIRAALQHNFPTAEIDVMNSQIEQGAFSGLP